MSVTPGSLVEFVRDQYRTLAPIGLHEPRFRGNEKAFTAEAIDSSFVSSVGPFVDRFEAIVAGYTGSPAAVATVNGTAALHAALRLAGVRPSDYVITQPLTFVATCNAIAYCGAEPIFVDVDRRTLGLSPTSLAGFLADQAERRESGSYVVSSGRRIAACVVMHTFGHPAQLDALEAVCDRWGLVLVEDAAESLGSLYRNRHTGTFGRLGTLSFNGNKIITTGGGGMILCSDADLGTRAKHLTTTAKIPHAWEYAHDEIAYNYRLPNINAALGCAQMEQLDGFLGRKRALAERYGDFLRGSDLEFVTEPPDCRSNYWLNAVVCADRTARDALLTYTNAVGVATRPIWKLMTRLPMFSNCVAAPLPNAEWLADRVVNLPSSVPTME